MGTLQERAGEIITSLREGEQEEAQRKQDEIAKREEVVGVQQERIMAEIASAGFSLEQCGASDLLHEMQEAWRGGSVQLSQLVVHNTGKTVHLGPTNRSRTYLEYFKPYASADLDRVLEILKLAKGGMGVTLSLTWNSLRGSGYSYGRPVGVERESEKRNVAIKLIDNDRLQVATLARTGYSELRDAVGEIDGIIKEISLVDATPENIQDWLVNTLAEILATMKEQDPCFPYGRIREKMNRWLRNPNNRNRYGIFYPSGGFFKYLGIENPNKRK